MKQKKKLAVLVSGSGSNLQAIIDAIKTHLLENTEISIVISNKKNAYALIRAENEKINNLYLNPKDFNTSLDFEKKLVETISNYGVDLIVLAGFTKILSESFVNSFPNKIINIHPALLPLFGGKDMYGERVHEAVLNSNVKESGCTVHFVTSEVDGGPIISQRKVPVLKGDTAETLSKRILEQEHKLIVESVNMVLFEKMPMSL